MRLIILQLELNTHREHLSRILMPWLSSAFRSVTRTFILLSIVNICHHAISWSKSLAQPVESLVLVKALFGFEVILYSP